MAERENFLTLLGLQLNRRNYVSRSFIECATSPQGTVWYLVDA